MLSTLLEPLINGEGHLALMTVYARLFDANFLITNKKRSTLMSPFVDLGEERRVIGAR